MNNFWKLLQESTITTTVITLAVIGAFLYMVVIQAEIPMLLETATGIVLGYFFGSKTENAKVQGAVERMADERLKEKVAAQGPGTE